MPNFCINFIEITGTKSNLDVLKRKLKAQKDESTNFMEYLIGLGDIPDNYYKGGWDDYNEERFGAKWDFPFSQLHITFEEDIISIIASSAWTPIVPFLSKLCKKYNVYAIIDYYEPCCDIGGRAEIHSEGKVHLNHCGFLEAVFLYDNGVFWEQVIKMIEEEQYETFEDLMEQFEFLSEDDKKKIEELWNEENNL